MSPAVKFLTMMWEHIGGGSCWQVVNWAMRDTLHMAVKSRMRFDAGDLSDIYGKFDARYWIGADIEWLYDLAIRSDNQSAIAMFEHYCGRRPFIATVDSRGGSAGYRHASGINMKRGRMAVGFVVQIEGKPWWVSSFDDEKGTVRLCRYAARNGWDREGKPVERKELTHENVLTLWPAPKKKKTKTEPTEELAEAA